MNDRSKEKLVVLKQRKFYLNKRKNMKFKKKGKVKAKEIEKRTEAQFNVLIISVVLG